MVEPMAHQMVPLSALLKVLQTVAHWDRRMADHSAGLRAGPSADGMVVWRAVLSAVLMAHQRVASLGLLKVLQMAVHWAPLMAERLAGLRAGPSAELRADWKADLMADLRAHQMVAASALLTVVPSAVHSAPLMVDHSAGLRAGPSADLKADWKADLKVERLALQMVAASVLLMVLRMAARWAPLMADHSVG